MESVIKKIFAENNDENVHNEFIKFGKGEFKFRYLIEAKKQKDKWSIKTSAEFTNFFVRKCLETVSGDLKLHGVIIYTSELDGNKLSVERVKQFMGVKQYIINTEAKAQDILELMENYPRAFYALSFSAGNCELKIKAKAPKNGKPSNKGEGEPKADFCSLKTPNKEIIDDLFFDVPDFKEIKVKHTIQINEVILPQGVEEPTKIRELARKKGKIIRELNIDGTKSFMEKDFEA